MHTLNTLNTYFVYTSIALCPLCVYTLSAQHHGAVPAAVQVRLEVAPPASVEGRGRDEEDLVHPQVGVKLFERLAVDELAPGVSLVPDFEARVHADLRPLLSIILGPLQSPQQFLDVEGSEMIMLSIRWREIQTRKPLRMEVMQKV